VEQYGYQSTDFDLPSEATSRVPVLLLEPLPLELEAINVVSESQLDELFQELRSRRNSYSGSVTAFDKARLDDLQPSGSVWDLIVTRGYGLQDCNPGAGGRSGLCLRGRPSINDPYPQIGVLVCIDGWESWSAITELESLDIRQVALVEIYGRARGGIRVYTAGYLASSSHRGRSIVTPLRFGC
jgi:hypothetical protein